MIAMLLRIGLSSIAVATIVSPPVAHARDLDSAADLYGRGVHAYFAGQSNEAETFLSRALAIDARDPRPYYFRALSRLRLGRTDEARADMMAGAALEAQRANRYAIGAALQRVQGSDRLLLEQFRRQARARAELIGDALGGERDRFNTDREAEVLRQKVVVPLDELLRPGGPRSLTAEEVARRALATQSIGAATAPTSTEVDPFQDDGDGDAPQPAAATPPQPAPAASAPSETPPASESEVDPFSGIQE